VVEKVEAESMPIGHLAVCQEAASEVARQPTHCPIRTGNRMWKVHRKEISYSIRTLGDSQAAASPYAGRCWRPSSIERPRARVTWLNTRTSDDEYRVTGRPRQVACSSQRRAAR